MAILVLPTGLLIAAQDNCGICGGRLERVVYFLTDQVVGDKKEICEKFAKNPEVCYQIGLPTTADRTTLADGRVLCARDGREAVLDNAVALQICRETKDALDRQFSRFTTFPDDNVVVSVVDRINLIELFKIPGNDYNCPNILGYTSQETNEFGRSHEISLMSGLTKPALKSVYAHELAHAWIFESVSPERQTRMRPEAREGFCELVAYLLMTAQGERTAIAEIRSNGYTRGQIDLFIEAESRFGFNEVVEWMKYGEDGSLRASDLTRVRAIVSPARSKAPARSVYVAASAPAPTFDQLTLQGITWSKTRPMATINGQTFEPRDEVKVRFGDTNITLRCLAISEDSVVVQAAGSSEAQTLRLKGR
jgi:hypothetical protein